MRCDLTRKPSWAARQQLEGKRLLNTPFDFPQRSAAR
jgi:hypothetical protein